MRIYIKTTCDNYDLLKSSINHKSVSYKFNLENDAMTIIEAIYSMSFIHAIINTYSLQFIFSII